MYLKIFSVYDKATEVFDKPFFLLTKAEAIRSFTREVNNTDSMLSQHSMDYHLYYLGTYDQSTGLTTQDQGPVDLGSAHSYKEQDNIAQFPSKEIESK